MSACPHEKQHEARISKEKAEGVDPGGIIVRGVRYTRAADRNTVRPIDARGVQRIRTIELAATVLAAIAACNRSDAPGEVHVDPPSESAPPAAPQVLVPALWPVVDIDDADPIHVLVTDPRIVARWDDAGLSLHAVLSRLHDARGWKGGALVELGASWGTIADTLQADIDLALVDMAIDWETQIDRTYDLAAARTLIGADGDHRGNGNVARVLDVGWLRAQDVRAPLVAMVYRPDRADFLPGTCGELRLVYRLAYLQTVQGGVRTSRLPFTINVVSTLPDDGARCREVARSFRAPAIGDDASAVADRLLAGPLAPERTTFRQIEIDAQIVRWPSDLERVDGRNFAGQALYWLRIFAPHGDRLVPVPLENTPDVQAIAADPSKRARLLESITADLDGIDRGVFRLPDDLLATLALSWSTHGSMRLANRPFATLFAADEAQAAFGARAEAVLERLDGATCMGCHQQASTAGFHLLGVDRPLGDDADAYARATDGNRLQSAISPHLRAEVPRRLAYAERLAAGLEPNRLRPHAGAPPAVWTDAVAHAPASAGMTCPLPGAAAAWSKWTCDQGSECRALVAREGANAIFGQCVARETLAGAPCRTVTIGTTEQPSGLAFNVRAFTDRVADVRLGNLGESTITANAYSCRPPKIGVPLGRVTRHCHEGEYRFATFDDAMPPEICAIVGGKGFEAMATGAFDASVFANVVGRGLLDTCTIDRPCREDYICQQIPEFLARSKHPATPERIASLHARGVGFCTPTYFVYQLRLDGHPKPR